MKINPTKYFHVDCGNTPALVQTPLWRAIYVGKFLCKVCNRLLPSRVGLDVYLECSERELDRREAACVLWHGGPLVVNSALLDRIPATVRARSFLVGKVFDVKDRELRGWQSVIGKHCIVIRGVKNIEFKECTGCRRNRYICYDFPGYIAQQPPKSLQIAESNSSSLIMSENIYTRILVQTGLRFRAEPLAVLSSPLDGLPADIPCFRTFDGG